MTPLVFDTIKGLLIAAVFLIARVVSYCYEKGRSIIDPDDESDGAPECDGNCERCAL